MRKFLTTALFAAAVSAGLSGCVLAPQTIQLNENSTIEAPKAEIQRGALIRVVDQRESVDEPEYLGNRGGRLAENSPLYVQDELAGILTTRLQDSMEQLGFGAASPDEPVKLELLVNRFRYTCNEGFLVTNCSVSIRFNMTVIDGGRTFTKPYGLSETRRVAAAPVKDYNEQWVNDVLDRLWEYIFSDPELREYLGV
ncbi:MAG: YajG family lipoprotein [Thalassolituus sp.]